MRLTLCLVVLVLAASSWSGCDAARILGVWPMEAPSHFFLGNRLFKELAARGHEVTMVSCFPQKTPVKNYRDVTLVGMRQAMEDIMPKGEKMDLLKLGHLAPWQQIIFTAMVGSKATELTLQQASFQKILSDPNEKFDLIIFEMFHTEALYGLAHKYNAPVIVLSTIGSSTWTNHLVANPAPSSYVPDLFTQYSGHMCLPQRMINTAINLFNEIYRRYWYFPEIDVTMHKYFPGAPSVFELMYKKTAMVLLNSHPSISEPKPHVPAMVEVGGFHVEDAKPLPKDLKDFMDKAPHGVILFSMGSNLKSTELNDEIREHLLKTFGKLKQKVIWKWEDENLPGKPDNVKIMKWCPQNDIMAHPNLKMFITHGGLLSTTEAVYHGVPIVGIPIFGDQKMNVEMTKRKGFGLGVNYAELTEEKLSAALNEILTKPQYRAAARQASQLLRGQPLKPLDAAMFWVDHVLQHRGADHFRSAGMDLSWCELYSVDIIGLIVLADIIIFAAFYYICKKICGGKKCAKKDLKDSKKKKN